MAKTFVCKGEALNAFSEGRIIELQSETGEIFFRIFLEDRDSKFIKEFSQLVVDGIEESFLNMALGDQSRFVKHFKKYFHHEYSDEERETLISYGINPDED